MFLRTHIGLLTFLGLAILAGIFLGQRAAGRAAAEEIGPAPAITSDDPRHPVERYFAPPFLRDLESVYQSLRLDVKAEDRVLTRPGIEFGLGGELYVLRALPVQVIDGGRVTTYRTWANTVGELLAEQRIEVGDRDRVEPAIDSVLALDQTIKITRVSVVYVTKTEAISFKTKIKDDPNRPRGEQSILQKGVSGERTLTYQVTRENGQEIGRKLIKTEVTKEPIDEIVARGTRVIVLGSGQATWYDPPWSGYTAAHNTLPKGTLVDVVNVANGKRVTVKINDRGIQGNAIIDLSVEAFKELAPLGAGVIQVRLEVAG